mmetsp:Transcript_9897/g.16281  ORF Transcript_9897/g.16281 Transcript_9897/m.16281 type:complete len:133 (-) Transcript_9897:149-547(-)|eukprot:CAMPEP_0184656996 /NCGR_PEP_ID=MMETSP0308-20130426/16892_1 /TAXON_ID=38269 /ORGANISM="Gloeochaete witrockiana, Strain SAG 46.84" /LENGTH=132 /DNA_ID=CAMNT_0027094341 /DNA_START=50 /DNA_END=448 /DNA_ORIENTATION=+
MSKRGVWQLKRLTIFYCSRGGSSRGAREYIDTRLVDFAKSNPQLQIIAAIRNGRHPFVHGEYVNDFIKTDGIKNLTQGEIHEKIMSLRDGFGQKGSKLATNTITKHPSIQGIWYPGLEKVLAPQQNASEQRI